MTQFEVLRTLLAKVPSAKTEDYGSMSDCLIDLSGYMASAELVAKQVANPVEEGK